MAGDLTVDVRNLPQVQNKLVRLQRFIRDGLRDATEQAVDYVHSRVPPYPAPPAAGAWGEWAAAHENAREIRAAFFRQLAAGVWAKRTGTLGREITTEVRTLGTDIVGVIGTDDVKAPWVISDEAVGDRGPQAGFHVGRWTTLQQVVRDAKAGVVRIFEQWLAHLGW